MPLLIQMDLGGGDIARASNEDVELTHFYSDFVVSIDELTYSIPGLTGGLVRPECGQVTFNPEMFKNHWNPPESCQIWIGYTDSTEEDAVLFFEGIAHLVGIERDGVTYELFQVTPTVAYDSVSFAGTFSSHLAAFCTAAGVTNDATLARAASPTMDFETSGTAYVALDLFSDAAAYFTHMLVLEGNGLGTGKTLRQIDMFADNGTMELDAEFTALAGCAYTFPVPPSEIRIDTDNAVQGAYWYGEVVDVSPRFGTEADSMAELARMKTLLERPQIELKLPMTAMRFDMGQRITWTDTSLYLPLVIEMWVRRINYDFDGEEITIVGDGGITA